MVNNDNKKHIPGIPVPPSPPGMGRIPPPLPVKPKQDKINKAHIKEKHRETSIELQGFDERLARERDELQDRIRERESENFRLQEKFLEKEREETRSRQEEINNLRKKLEAEYIKREKELTQEKEKWKQTLDDIRKETRGKIALEKTQNQIRQLAFEEAQNQVSEQMKEMKKELEEAKKQTYEEKIKHREEEKNTVKVEQALREVIQGVSRNQKLSSIENEKEALKEELRDFEDHLAGQKLEWGKKLTESESLRENLRLDYQSRLKEQQLKFENSISELQTLNAQLNNQVWQHQYRFENKKELLQEKMRDKVNDSEKLISDFRAKISEIKYEYRQRLSESEQKKEAALKDYRQLSGAYEEKRIELNSKVNSLTKEKDLLQREARSQMDVLNEKLKDREREFFVQKKLLQENAANLEIRLQSQEGRWQEKINEVIFKHETRNREIKSKYDTGLSKYEAEISKLTSENQDIETEYRKFKNRFEIDEDYRKTSHEKILSEFEKEKEKYEKTKNEIEAGYNSKIEHLKIEYSEQKDKLDILSAEKEKIEKETQQQVEKLTGELNQAKLKNTELIAYSKNRDLEVTGLNRALGDLNNRNKELQDKLVESNNDKEDIAYEFQKELQKIHKGKTYKIQEIGDKHSRQLELLQNQVVESRRAVGELREQKDARIQSLTNEFENYKVNFGWLKQEWLHQKEELRREFEKKEIQYRSQVSGLKLAMEETERLRIDETQKFQLQAVNLQQKNQYEIKDIKDIFSSRISQLKVSLEEAEKLRIEETQKFNIELKSIQEKNQRETEKYKAEFRDRVAELERAKNETEDELKKAGKETRMWEDKYIKEDKENKIIRLELEKREDDLKKEIDRIKEKYDELVRVFDYHSRQEKPAGYRTDDALANEVKQLRDDNYHLNQELERRERELIELRERFNTYKDSISGDIEKFRKDIGRVDDARREMEKLRYERRYAVEDLTGGEEKIKSLQKEFEESHAVKDRQIAGLASRLEEKEEILSELKSQLKQLEKGYIEQNQISEEVRMRDEENKELKAQIEEKEIILNEMNEIKDKSEQQNNEILAKLDEKDKRIKQLEVEVSRSVSDEELDEKDKEIRVKEDVITELKKELEESIKQIESNNNRIKELSGRVETASVEGIREELRQKYEEKSGRLSGENEELKGRVQELKAQLDVGLDEMKKGDTGKIDEKWKNKWEKREKEIEEFVDKAKKSMGETNKLKEKLDIALHDQKTLSQLAEKESRQRKEISQKHAALIQALEESKKSFARKLLEKFKGSGGILLL